jgi:hypothetical protein
MTDEQREWLRCHITGVLTDGETAGDCLFELGRSGLSPMIHMLITVLGWLLAMIGGF